VTDPIHFYLKFIFKHPIYRLLLARILLPDRLVSFYPVCTGNNLRVHVPCPRDREMVRRYPSCILQGKARGPNDADLDRWQLDCWDRIRIACNRTRRGIPEP
jgi:hypothetical protein